MRTYVLLAVAAFLFLLFVANESSHGDVAQATGVGHRHLLDHGGAHCGPASDGRVWPHHHQPYHPPYGAEAGCDTDHMRDAHGWVP